MFVENIFIYCILSKIGIESDPALSSTIFNTVAMKIERFSESTHFFLMKITLFVFVVPPMITTYFKYYILRLDDASFPDEPLMYGWGVFWKLNRKINKISYYSLFKVAIQWKNAVWIFVCIIFKRCWKFFHAHCCHFCIESFTGIDLVINFLRRELRKWFVGFEYWKKIKPNYWATKLYFSNIFGCKRVKCWRNSIPQKKILIGI